MRRMMNQHFQQQDVVTVMVRMLAVVLMVFCLQIPLVNAAAPCGSGDGVVLRSMFTTALNNREPQDHVLVLENSATEVYFFTELSQLQGHTITHRWEYEGRVVYTKSYEIKGPRWRAVSRKELDPTMTGRWSVVVIDENNCPYKAGVFQYVQASKNENQAVILPP